MPISSHKATQSSRQIMVQKRDSFRIPYDLCSDFCVFIAKNANKFPLFHQINYQMVFVATEITIKKHFSLSFDVLLLVAFLYSSVHFHPFCVRLIQNGIPFDFAKCKPFVATALKIECHQVSMDDVAKYLKYPSPLTTTTATAPIEREHRKKLPSIKRKFTFSNYFVIGFYCCLSFIIATLLPHDCYKRGKFMILRLMYTLGVFECTKMLLTLFAACLYIVFSQSFHFTQVYLHFRLN